MSPTATRSRPSRNDTDDAADVLDGRRRADRRGRRRALLAKTVLPLLVLLLIAVGIWVVGFSSVFSVRQVDVNGAHVLAPATVEQAARVPTGLPLARLDLAAVTQRVESIRGVETAQVSRHWPSGVEIRLTERTPVFAIEQSDGYLLIDAHGVGYRTVESKPSGMAVATVGNDGTGPNSTGSTTLLTEVAQVAAALPADIRADLVTISATTPDSIQLNLTKGRTVVWGSSERSADKADVLSALLGHKASSYDVSAPDTPAIKK